MSNDLKALLLSTFLSGAIFLLLALGLKINTPIIGPILFFSLFLLLKNKLNSDNNETK